LAPHGFGNKVRVLGEKQPARTRRTVEQLRVGETLGVVFLRGQHVDTATAQPRILGNGTWTSM